MSDPSETIEQKEKNKYIEILNARNPEFTKLLGVRGEGWVLRK